MGMVESPILTLVLYDPVVEVWIVINYASTSVLFKALFSNSLHITACNEAMAQQEYKLLGDTLLEYKGTVFLLDNVHSKEFIDDLPQFEVRDDDVYLVTFPKSGDNLRYNIWQQLKCVASDLRITSYFILQNYIYMLI